MSDGKQKQVRLSAIGFDFRSEESFRIAFKGPGKGKAILVDDDKADGGIINMDSASAKTLWESFRAKNPDKPAIILGVTDPGIEGAVFVKKPAGIDQMLEAVDRLIAELKIEEEPPLQPAPKIAPQPTPLFREEAALKPSSSALPKQVKKQAPPAQAPAPKVAPKAAAPSVTPARNDGDNAKFSLFYNPRDYLQSEIHSAVDYSREHQVAVEIWIMTGDDRWGKIIFLPGLKKVLSSFSDNDLKQYCSTPLTLVTHKMYRRKPKDTQELEQRMEGDQRGCRYDSFLWKIALYTSLGRLPQGTNLSSSMHLKHWPNLTRLYPLGGSMRIATLLVDQPRTLPLIAKVLKMPVGRVFSFYSAACAIGIVESTESVDVNLAKTIVPKKHRDHTLFGKILKRLRNGESELEAYA